MARRAVAGMPGTQRSVLAQAGRGGTRRRIDQAGVPEPEVTPETVVLGRQPGEEAVREPERESEPPPPPG